MACTIMLAAPENVPRSLMIFLGWVDRNHARFTTPETQFEKLRITSCRARWITEQIPSHEFNFLFSDRMHWAVLNDTVCSPRGMIDADCPHSPPISNIVRSCIQKGHFRRICSLYSVQLLLEPEAMRHASLPGGRALIGNVDKGTKPAGLKIKAQKLR
ncbi:hypothetical protein BDV11DRAFT_26851 [Aspergillus similis]